jgi:hypothetical protein
MQNENAHVCKKKRQRNNPRPLDVGVWVGISAGFDPAVERDSGKYSRAVV